MLIASIVIIVLALIACAFLAGKAFHLWVVIPYEKDRDRYAEMVSQRRTTGLMLVCPSLFLFIFALDLNSLVDRIGADLPHTLGIFLCLFFIVGLSILGFKMHSIFEQDPKHKDRDVMQAGIGISMYGSIICMMLLGNLIQSTFLIPMHIGLAVLVTGILMSKKTEEVEFPGSEFIRAGIIFSVIGALIYSYNYLGLNWF